MMTQFTGSAPAWWFRESKVSQLTQRVRSKKPQRRRNRNARDLSLAITFCATLATQGALADEKTRVCGTRTHTNDGPIAELATGDRTNCSATATNPEPRYAEGGLYELKLAVHVIQNERGDGALSDEEVAEQIQVLNEDFRALAETSGVDTQFTFALANVDPEGQPTTGITRDVNDTWFSDRGAYWKELAWDPERYVNVYTNDAAGLLGYSFLPADADSEPGEPFDRVVVHWEHFGRNRGEAGNLGRTLTHELGHYLGLDHPFAPNPTTPQTFVCAPAEPPRCYQTGDLICDTPSEDSANDSCEPRDTCGVPNAIENFMDYTPDECMERFSPEQALRMRCTVLAFRRSAPWPAARLSAREQTREDGTATFAVDVANDSPFAQDFALRTTEGDFSLSFDGAPNVEGLHLEPGERALVDVQVALGSGPDTGSVTVEADTSVNETVARIVLDIVADPPPALAISAALERVLVSSEVETRVPVTIENRGVVSESLALGLDSAWEAEWSAAGEEFVLQAFERRELEVLVRAPSSARPGERVDLSITAVSLRDPDVSEEVNVELEATRWVGAEFSAPTDAIAVRPGQSGNLSLELSNLGNTSESFRLVLQASTGIEAWPETWMLGPLAPLGRGGPEQLPIRYVTAETLTPGDRLQVDVSALAQDLAEAVATARLELIVVGVGRVELAPRLQSAAASWGSSRRFVVSLTNASEEADEFAIELRTESLLLASPPERVSLSARESLDLGLELSPAILGRREVTQLTVVSLTHPNRTQSAELVLVSQPSSDAGATECDNECRQSEPGCACRAGTGRPDVGWAFVLTLLGWLRRRTFRGSSRERLQLSVGDHQHR
jgi:hypothetical protein